MPISLAGFNLPQSNEVPSEVFSRTLKALSESDQMALANALMARTMPSAISKANTEAQVAAARAPYAGSEEQQALQKQIMENRALKLGLPYTPFEKQAGIREQESRANLANIQAQNLARTMGQKGNFITQGGNIIGNTGVGQFSNQGNLSNQQLPNPYDVLNDNGDKNVQNNMIIPYSNNPDKNQQMKNVLDEKMKQLNAGDSNNYQDNGKNGIYVRPSNFAQGEMEQSINKIRNSNLDLMFNNLMNGYQGQKTYPGFLKYEFKKLSSRVSGITDKDVQSANQYDEAHSALTDLIRSTYTHSVGKAQADMFANSLNAKPGESEKSYISRMLAMKFRLEDYASKQSHALQYGIPQDDLAQNETKLSTFNPQKLVDLHKEDNDAFKLVYHSLSNIEKQKFITYNNMLKKAK